MEVALGPLELLGNPPPHENKKPWGQDEGKGFAMWPHPHLWHIPAVPSCASPFSSRMLSGPLFACLALALGLASATTRNRDTQRVAGLVSDFGVKIFQQMALAAEDLNVVLSPYGVSSVMAMLQAATAGDSRKQIERAMGFQMDGETRGSARWGSCQKGRKS